MSTQLRKKMIKRKRAFTLMEVLIVAGILALLAAFVVPSLLKTGEQARKQLARAAVGHSGPLAGQIDKFYLDTGQYPETLEDLIKQPSYIEEDEEGENPWMGPYIKDARGLRDPWKNEYQYKQPGDVYEDAYDLWSMGVDGNDGTEDDITSWPKNQ